MLRTFFKNVSLRSLSSYAKSAHGANVVKDSPNIIDNKIFSNPTTPPPQEKTGKVNKELLKQYPNRISKEQMDEFLTEVEHIKKQSSAY